MRDCIEKRAAASCGRSNIEAACYLLNVIFSKGNLTLTKKECFFIWPVDHK